VCAYNFSATMWRHGVQIWGIEEYEGSSVKGWIQEVCEICI